MSLRADIKARFFNWLILNIDYYRAIDSIGKEPEGTKAGGRIVQVTSPAEYIPDLPKRSGGRIVRRMPRSLQKIKEAQEKTSDV